MAIDQKLQRHTQDVRRAVQQVDAAMRLLSRAEGYLRVAGHASHPQAINAGTLAGIYTELLEARTNMEQL